jgi:signal transduction histidine kinase
VTIRRRILLATLATILTGVGVLVAAGNLLLGERVEAETSGLLRVRAEAQLAGLTVTQTRVKIRETSDEQLDRQAWVVSSAGQVIERPPGANPRLDAVAVALGRAGRPTEASAFGDIQLRVQPVLAPGSRARVATIVVGVSTAAVHRLQTEVLVGSLVAALAILLTTGVAIRTALGRALNPVARMTGMAEDWGAHDLDQRFDLGPPRDELMALAATLDHLLGRIAASRRHEQRFASELAHELRTPLARIQAQAELALSSERPDGDSDRRDALTTVVGQCRELERVIETLLAAARQELDPAATQVDVRQLGAELEGVRLTGPAALPAAEGDPAVIRRAIAPLLENARAHARRSIWIELGSGDGRVRLTVRDDGPGVRPGLEERVFEPGFRGPGENGDGAGLGLPLARRLARSCGGEVRAEPGPGGRFVLELRQLGD